MKKTLAVLAVMLMIGTSGCGSCRGLFCKAKRPLGGQILTRCAPVCAPTCAPSCAPTCNSCSSGPTMGMTNSNCGCETGTPVTYGFDGGNMGGNMYYPGVVEELPAGGTADAATEE